VAVLASVAIVVTGAASSRAGRPAPAPPPRVTVAPGDTLWDIAERVGPPGADLRSTVDSIAARNGLGSVDLAPGQVLDIP